MFWNISSNRKRPANCKYFLTCQLQAVVSYRGCLCFILLGEISPTIVLNSYASWFRSGNMSEGGKFPRSRNEKPNATCQEFRKFVRFCENDSTMFAYLLNNIPRLQSTMGASKLARDIKCLFKRIIDDDAHDHTTHANIPGTIIASHSFASNFEAERPPRVWSSRTSHMLQRYGWLIYAKDTEEAWRLLSQKFGCKTTTLH